MLRPVEAVRCLDCGKDYAKPSGRGTLTTNPGCPECGYLGWVPSSARLTAASSRDRSGEDRPQHLSSRSG
jgi:predicted  nucleic acid-binding Zn-ribbon protein